MHNVRWFCLAALLFSAACGGAESSDEDQTGVTSDALDARSHFFFNHSAAWSNTSGNATVIDHPSVNGRPNASLIVTHNSSAFDYTPWGPARSVNPHNLAVRYDSATGRWSIFNTDGAGMIVGTRYAVSVEQEGFAHRASAANIAGWITFIDHPAANGNPWALLTVTHNQNPGLCCNVLNPHKIGVYYDPSSARWSIFNQDFAPMPNGAAFNVHVMPATDQVSAMRYTTHPWGMFFIDHPIANGHPEAIVTVSQNWTVAGVYNNHDIGIYYDFNHNQWVIYNLDGTTLPNNAGFNVEVHRFQQATNTEVPEWSSANGTALYVQPGDRLQITCWDSIWCGTWFTGNNGPEGQPDIEWSSAFPLPGARRFSAIGRVGTGSYFYVGASFDRTFSGAAGSLTLRTNDDWPGNGSGAFHCTATVTR
jgi:hypothetical protein